MRIEERWLSWWQFASLVCFHAWNDEQNDTAEYSSGKAQCSLDLISQDKADKKDKTQKNQREGKGSLGDLIRFDGGEEDLEDILTDNDDIDWECSHVQKQVKGDDVVDEVQPALEVLAIVD